MALDHLHKHVDLPFAHPRRVPIGRFDATPCSALSARQVRTTW